MRKSKRQCSLCYWACVCVCVFCQLLSYILLTLNRFAVDNGMNIQHIAKCLLFTYYYYYWILSACATMFTILQKIALYFQPQTNNNKRHTHCHCKQETATLLMQHRISFRYVRFSTHTVFCFYFLLLFRSFANRFKWCGFLLCVFLNVWMDGCIFLRIQSHIEICVGNTHRFRVFFSPEACTKPVLYLSSFPFHLSVQCYFHVSAEK